jgi:hypothetical protein
MVSPTPPILWTLSLSSSSSSSCCLGIYIKSMQTCELHMATLEVYITIDRYNLPRKFEFNQRTLFLSIFTTLGINKYHE